MHINDLDELVSANSDNILKILALDTGVVVNSANVKDLEATLESRLASSYSEGVSYHDISHLKTFTELEPLTSKLDPSEFSMTASFRGLSSYQKILKASLIIIHNNKVG